MFKKLPSPQVYTFETDKSDKTSYFSPTTRTGGGGTNTPTNGSGGGGGNNNNNNNNNNNFSYILLENGFYILQENGSKIYL
jgi:hypothetical protein